MDKFFADLVGIIWGLPMVCLLVGAGLYFTVMLRGIQFRLFKHAIDVVRGKFDDPNDKGEINHFGALCTALSGTVGLGNIAGVAVAIKMGGPGATLWMILAGIIGMASKYTECTLSLKYRKINEDGSINGGAMYYIEKGLGKKFISLSYLFAFCIIVAALGAANMFQANQVGAILESSFSVPPILTGVVLAVFTAIVIIGGIERIGSVASYLVPSMAALYVIGCLIVIFTNIEKLPEVISNIFSSAFAGSAAAGGFTGAGVKQVLIQGVRRAVFSNEAGLGTAAIAHSAAKTDEPVREGVVALLEPFIDTVVICTMTALLINITGVWTGPETGVNLTAAAFDKGLPGFGTYFIPVAVALFAFSTIISWSYYGQQGAVYLFGNKAIIPYKIIFCLAAIVGCIWPLTTIINMADSIFGIMVIPNIIALLLLFPVVKKETEEYEKKLRNNSF